MIMTGTIWVWNPRCLRPPPTRAAVPRRIFQPQDTRCQEPECFHSKRAHAGDGGRARAVKSRKYQPLGSQFTCFLGVSIGNFIAPLPRRGENEKNRNNNKVLKLYTPRYSSPTKQFPRMSEPWTGSWKNPRERQVGNIWLRRELETAWVFAPMEGWPATTPRGKRKSKTGEGWMEREPCEDERATLSPKRGARRLGAEQLEGRREGEAHCSVTPAPEGVCSRTPAHTHSHTLARARARAGTSAPLGRAGRTSPTPAPAPRPPGDAPHSPSRENHWTSGWRGTGERATRATLPPRAAQAALLGRARSGCRRRAEERRLAPRAPPGAAAGSGFARAAAGGGGRRREAAGGSGRGGPEAAVGRGAGSGRQARCYLLARPARGRAWRRPRRARWSCSRRHASLPGRRCRRRRKGRGGTSTSRVTSCHRSHPGRTPHLLVSLHVFTPVRSRAWFSRLRPKPTSPAPSEEAGASHEPFVLGPLRVGSALLAREARSLGAAWSLPQLPGWGRFSKAGEGTGEAPGPLRKAELPRPGGPGSPRARLEQVQRISRHVPGKKINREHFPFPSALTAWA